MMKKYKHSQGFTLVEILVAMVIGLLVLSGAFALHSGTRSAQKMNEAQMDMAADARFAIEMITSDLRHAGMWGGTNKDELIQCKSSDSDCTASAASENLPSVVTNDCITGTNSWGGSLWAYDLSRPVFATDGQTAANPYGSTCLSGENFLAGTDMLEIKYADSNAPPTGLLANQAYIRSNFENGKVFIGVTQPVIDRRDVDPDTLNHVLHAYTYYISSNTDGNDGIPSLRRASLVRGPVVQNQMLISGVVDLQVQLGEDIDGLQDATGNLTIDRYVNPENVINWSQVYAVKVWLLMRSDKQQITKGVNTSKTFELAGATVTKDGTDGYRYFMVSSIINLRNVKPL